MIDITIYIARLLNRNRMQSVVLVVLVVLVVSVSVSVALPVVVFCALKNKMPNTCRTNQMRFASKNIYAKY